MVNTTEYLKVKKFFQTYEEIVKGLYPNIMSSGEAAEKLIKNGKLLVSDYLGEENGSLAVTTVFIMNN